MEDKGYLVKLKCLKNWDFPGGPVVGTWPYSAGVQVQSLVRELGSHMPRGQKSKT